MGTEEIEVIQEETPGTETTVIEKTADERIAEAVSAEREAARVSAEESNRQLTQAQQRAANAERALSAANVRAETKPIDNLGELLTTDPEKAAKLIQDRLVEAERKAQHANIRGTVMEIEREYDRQFPDLQSKRDKEFAAKIFEGIDPTLSIPERVKATGLELRGYVNAKKSEDQKAKETKNKELHKAQVISGGGDKPPLVSEKEETQEDYIKSRTDRFNKSRGLI